MKKIKLTQNFYLHEFHCKDKDSTPVPYEHLINVFRMATVLQLVRSGIERKLFINSGYRTREHNQEVGGAKNSYHLKGLAVDIHAENMSSSQLMNVIYTLKQRGLIRYKELLVYPTHVHFAIEELT